MANVHKDFHGALSYALQHLCNRYGQRAMEAYLRQVGREVYRPLSEKLKRRGLSALEEHWQRVFTLEGGVFGLYYEGQKLVLRVDQCPAIHHMKAHSYPIADRFCEHTRIVNEQICHAAGYDCSVEYDQDTGACTQYFWRPEG